ncbi:MAG: hypothetical protein JO288_16425 [Hyphomicrobiales bacterium]|nr:hypothetical protein [Hyphomicrobiales bacterium]
MNDQPPPHVLFRHYSELPYSLRTLITCMLLILGLGYLFALLNIYFTYAGRAGGNPVMLSYEDIVAAYSGTGEGSVLESALRGPMSTMLPTDERALMLKWVRDGAAQPAYDSEIRLIVDRRCLTCHDGRNPHLPSFTTFEGVRKATEQDTGASIATLVRVSHIHLFGVTFIFFIVGLAFTHAYVRPVWLKCAVIALPFLAIAIDVSSWYLIKLFHPFAWVEIGAGAAMAACFAVMWLTALYQMWFMKPPVAILRRMGGDIPLA